jgi:pimeloyl-ACP methyl ester carboxylesterase
VLFPAVRHEVSFWHGADRLIGDLVLPATPGPHPVLLVVAGDGDHDRDRSGWLDGLAQAGIASFSWDRRGPSAGSGRPARDDVRLRAREVLAAWEKLDYLSEVDTTAGALVGWGTGGWAAAQAATFAGRARAVILLSTPMVSAVQLAEHRFALRLREQGLAAHDVTFAREVLRERWYRLADGESVARILADDVAHRDRPWFWMLPGIDQLGDVDAPVDPRPTLSGVTVPVLALYGEQDPLLPLEDCVRGVRLALRSAGHRDHQVAVVRGADHGLRVRPGHGLGRLIDGRHQFGDWPAGLTECIVGWLEGRLRETVQLPSFAPPATAVPASGGGARDAQSLGALPPGPVAASRRPESGHGLVPVRQVRRRLPH